MLFLIARDLTDLLIELQSGLISFPLFPLLLECANWRSRDTYRLKVRDE